MKMERLDIHWYQMNHPTVCQCLRMMLCLYLDLPQDPPDTFGRVKIPHPTNEKRLWNMLTNTSSRTTYLNIPRLNRWLNLVKQQCSNNFSPTGVISMLLMVLVRRIQSVVLPKLNTRTLMLLLCMTILKLLPSLACQMMVPVIRKSTKSWIRSVRKSMKKIMVFSIRPVGWRRVQRRCDSSPCRRRKRTKSFNCNVWRWYGNRNQHGSTKCPFPYPS